ncbi:hypothetical protein N7535_003834 [Penicillium sp. DV-2018c]|nr:hypothetical protein N7461_000464 [Penicillium sp. DV-2018c]KAJ5576908.1 hypothetical protein N7535_003834 [Penicillium sp. DV-2018c]
MVSAITVFLQVLSFITAAITILGACRSLYLWARRRPNARRASTEVGHASELHELGDGLRQDPEEMERAVGMVDWLRETVVGPEYFEDIEGNA